MPEKRISEGLLHWQTLENGLPKEGISSYFADEAQRKAAFEAARWPGGVRCPECGCSKISFLTTVERYACTGCRKQFTSRVGTFMQASKLGYGIWYRGAEVLIKHFAKGHERPPQIDILGYELGIAIPSAHKLRGKLFAELSLDGGGLLGTIVCVQPPSQ